MRSLRKAHALRRTGCRRRRRFSLPDEQQQRPFLFAAQTRDFPGLLFCGFLRAFLFGRRAFFAGAPLGERACFVFTLGALPCRFRRVGLGARALLRHPFGFFVRGGACLRRREQSALFFGVCARHRLCRRLCFGARLCRRNQYTFPRFALARKGSSLRFGSGPGFRRFFGAPLQRDFLLRLLQRLRLGFDAPLRELLRSCLCVHAFRSGCSRRGLTLAALARERFRPSFGSDPRRGRRTQRLFRCFAFAACEERARVRFRPDIRRRFGLLFFRDALLRVVLRGCCGFRACLRKLRRRLLRQYAAGRRLGRFGVGRRSPACLLGGEFLGLALCALRRFLLPLRFGAAVCRLSQRCFRRLARMRLFRGISLCLRSCKGCGGKGFFGGLALAKRGERARFEFRIFGEVYPECVARRRFRLCVRL